jgi:hypothetical protein
MSETKKTIKINPDLFKISNQNKTKREKKEKLIKQPLIINPNSLKKHFLNRIKEHKAKESTEKENYNKKLPEKSEKKNLDNDIHAFTEEFNDSINYLSSLSNRQKQNSDKEAFLKKRDRHTLKNPLLKPSLNPSFKVDDLTPIQLELPESLKETINKEPIISLRIDNSDTVKLQRPINLYQSDIYTIDNHIPYGCLKNGNKPTYKTWQKTKKNLITSSSSPIINIENNLNNSNIKVGNQGTPPFSEKERSSGDRRGALPPTQNEIIIKRQEKLEILKNKIKQQDEERKLSSQPLILMKPDVCLEKIDPKTPLAPSFARLFFQPLGKVDPKAPSEPLFAPLFSKVEKVEDEEKQKKNRIDSKANNKKKIIKKTIKTKYTLGKNKMKNTVSVLIKNNVTRKKVIDAQKELKKISIQEIKRYLKNHGMIKTGSNAPVDVLRKMYESSILAGEINNNNKDTLLHNFIHSTE